MSASPALRPDDLDELEFHLRDSVALLQSKGLSAREAFWVAKSRVGTNDALDCEFGKVNADQVWLNRALWMVLGLVAMGMLSTLLSALANLSTVVVHNLTGEERLLGPLSLIVYLAAFIGLLLLVWRSGRRSNGIVWQIGSWMKTHPIAAAIRVFLFMALSSVIAWGVNVFMHWNMPASPFGKIMLWHLWVPCLSAFFWPFVLAWLLVRTARKPVIQ